MLGVKSYAKCHVKTIPSVKSLTMPKVKTKAMYQHPMCATRAVEEAALGCLMGHPLAATRGQPLAATRGQPFGCHFVNTECTTYNVVGHCCHSRGTAVWQLLKI